MARTPKFSWKEIEKGKWQVNIPATVSESRKRERHFFPTREKAKEHAQTLRKNLLAHGGNAAAIKPSLAEAAVAAEAILAPWGGGLVEAARFFAAAKEREAASKPLAEATAEWLLACAHLRDTTLTGYRQTIKRLDAALGSKTLAAITTAELQAAIVPAGTTPAVAAHRYRHARAFWRWSCRKKWCLPEPLNEVELPKLRTDGEIGILTPTQAEILLRVAETHFPAAVPCYALQLFAGIRVEELARLETENVSIDGIELGASITKKGRRRHITPNKTLAAWLAKHPFTPCPNWRRVDRACRYLAGWGVAPPPELVTVPELKPGEKPPIRPAWPPNALRHSHASFAVAAGTSLQTLLFEFGHTGKADVLRAHYIGKASKKQALEFFAIRPEGETAEAVQLESVEAVA